MGERTQYAPGTFSWAELATSDADAAKSFYAEVFGWSYDDRPLSEEAGGGVYSMAVRDGKEVAALFSTADQPPHWNCYVTVASADDAAARAGELGGAVMLEPFDVMDVGRMAVIGDPTGAALCLWEARSTIGARLVNQPGAMTWNDLLTPDADAAAGFYAGLFGWRVEEVPNAMGYRVIYNGERSNGGIMPMGAGMEGTPPSWMPYFGHDDARGLAERIGELGGRRLTGPIDMLQGTIAALADPQGAVFSVWTGQYDD